jgi:DNA processing protein
VTIVGSAGAEARTVTLVAASFLAISPGTRAQRFIKTLDPQSCDRSLLDRLAEAMAWPPAESRSRIETALARARRALDAAARNRLTVIAAGDDAYPDLLRHIVDPPIVLWVRGSPQVLQGPQVAVVGARAASCAGLAAARELGQELARSGLTVVSGMARGADGAAHAGALDGGGATVAVLGCGADVVYPEEHLRLAERIAETGAIVSELAPGALPLRHHFPLRNRIISGLAKAVVVIEASSRSGSLITAREALDQGRDVLAVPGPIGSGRSRGCHALIRDGARLVDSVKDILEEIGWRRAPRAGVTNKSLQMSDLEETMAAGESYTVEDLASRTGRPARELLAELGELELAGRISRIAGGAFVKA